MLAVAASAVLALPSPTRADTPIPEDLPDINNTHRSEFDGPGAQISNQGSGYYLGRIINKKDQFMQTIPRRSRLWSFGIIVRFNSAEPSVCGVVEAKVISDKDAVYGNLNDPCTPLLGDIKNRNKIGKGFNGAPGQYVDGAPTNLLSSPNCDLTAWYNYGSNSKSFDNISYPQTKGGFYDFARKLDPGEKVYYRYTKLDGKAANVRIDVRNGQGGWVYVSSGCINGYPQGGVARKTADTVPGANPNAGATPKATSSSGPAKPR